MFCHSASTKSLATLLNVQLLSCQILDVSIQAVIILVQVNVRLKKRKQKQYHVCEIGVCFSACTYSTST